MRWRRRFLPGDVDAIVVYWAAAVGIDPGAGGDPVTMAMSFTCD